MDVEVEVKFDIEKREELINLTKKFLAEIESEYEHEIKDLKVIYKPITGRTGFVRFEEVANNDYKIYLDSEKIVSLMTVKNYEVKLKSIIKHEFKHLVDMRRLLEGVDKRVNKLNKKFLKTRDWVSEVISKRIDNLFWMPEGFEVQVRNYLVFNHFLQKFFLELRAYYDAVIKDLIESGAPRDFLILNKGSGFKAVEKAKELRDYLINSIRKGEEVEFKRLKKEVYVIVFYTGLVMGLAAEEDKGFRKKFKKFLKGVSITKAIWLSQVAFKKYRQIKGLDPTIKNLLRKSPVGYNEDKSIIPFNTIRAKILKEAPQELDIDVEAELKKLKDVIIVP